VIGMNFKHIGVLGLGLLAGWAALPAAMAEPSASAPLPLSE
jgi:hypothetical protein